MNEALTKLTSFLQSYAIKHSGYSKEQIAKATVTHFNLTKTRSVFHCPKFAIRFSSASGTSFSNVVLSLSVLKKYDSVPFIVCIIRVVRPKEVELLLANATFLKKISHSSQRLRVDNIRGSFLGHDIMRTYNGIENTPNNFDVLFKTHTQITWEDNIARLVKKTNAIVPTGIRFEPSNQEKQNILNAPKIAASLSKHPEYRQVYNTLNKLVHDNKNAILKAGKIDNVNRRGNTIEQIITKVGNFHSLDDVSWTLSIGPEVKIDIKTKILTLSSSPKGYNIDKVLKSLAIGNTVISFFFIGINVEKKYIVTCLVSIFDRTILNATRLQFHWAGRNSRGVAQLTGDLTSIFNRDFLESIDIPKAIAFLQKLISLKPGPINWGAPYLIIDKGAGIE